MNKLYKVSFAMIGVGMIIGFVGQIIWAIIFWNNDSLFMGHWIVALVGLGMCFLAVIPATIALLKSNP